MVQLYDHPLSPFRFKVRILLYGKGIEFENKELHSEGVREELLKVNPRGEVPALRDGDAVAPHIIMVAARGSSRIYETAERSCPNSSEAYDGLPRARYG